MHLRNFYPSVKELSLVVCPGLLLLLSACSAVGSSIGGFVGKDDANSVGPSESTGDQNLNYTGDKLVYRIQEQLKTLGYYSGSVDGKLTSRTEASIQDFQLESGIPIDGKATELLLDQLSKKTATIVEHN